MRLFLRLPIVALIVGFWGVMWWLLIRSELRPDEGMLRALPPELVLKQAFQHGQRSDLYLHEGGQAIGHLRLEPSMQADGATVLMQGNLLVRGSKPGDDQRAAWNGTLFLDTALSPQRLQATWAVRFLQPGLNAPPVRIELEADFTQKRASYRYSQGETLMTEQSFTLDQNGFNELLQQWGVNFPWSEQLPSADTAEHAEVLARLTRFQFHGEEIEVNVISIKRSNQTWVEIFVSQTGQILKIQTLWGSTLTSE